jgi:hypothetical protein
MLRHRDIRTTCNLYLDLGLVDLAEAALNLPRTLGKENGAHVFANSEPSALSQMQEGLP